MIGTLDERVNLVARNALLAQQETEYPADIIGAQAAIESGWLTSTQGNNAFGWKARKGESRQLLLTTEVFTLTQLKTFLASGDGRTARPMTGAERIKRKLPSAPSGKAWYIVQDWFATFPTLREAFIIHAQKLQEGRYKPGWDEYRKLQFATYAEGIAYLAETLEKAGYATAPDYGEAVTGVALGWRLQQALARARKEAHANTTHT